tara:strand:- start:819 stop:4361 length:3543 start_codon:yes stop_codon:yes gene_type:complete
MDKQMQAFALGGLKDEGGEIDEASGNRVPIGGTKEGVRDDIPANVSEGEFVMPADVVRYHGLDKMMALRQEAKMGLKQMDAMGQMGNSDEATMPDDLPFEMADLIVVGGQGEPMEFANGGFVPQMQTLPTAPVPTMGGPTGNVTPIVYDDFAKAPVVTMQEYRNAAGESLIITYVNGKATTEIPAGYSLYTPPANTAPSTAQAVIQAANNYSYQTSGGDEGPDTPRELQVDPDYASMDNSTLFATINEQNSFGVKAGKTAASAIALTLAGPFGLLSMNAMNADARKLEQLGYDRYAAMPNGPEKIAYGKTLSEVYGQKVADPKEKNALVKFGEGILSFIGLNNTDAKAVSTQANEIVSKDTNVPAVEQAPTAAVDAGRVPAFERGAEAFAKIQPVTSERIPAGNTQEYYDSLINKVNITKRAEGKPELDESMLFQPGMTQPSPTPQRAGPTAGETRPQLRPDNLMPTVRQMVEGAPKGNVVPDQIASSLGNVLSTEANQGMVPAPASTSVTARSPTDFQYNAQNAKQIADEAEEQYNINLNDNLFKANNQITQINQAAKQAKADTLREQSLDNVSKRKNKAGKRVGAAPSPDDFEENMPVATEADISATLENTAAGNIDRFIEDKKNSVNKLIEDSKSSKKFLTKDEMAKLKGIGNIGYDRNGKLMVDNPDHYNLYNSGQMPVAAPAIERPVTQTDAAFGPQTDYGRRIANAGGDSFIQQPNVKVASLKDSPDMFGPEVSPYPTTLRADPVAPASTGYGNLIPSETTSDFRSTDMDVKDYRGSAFPNLADTRQGIPINYVEPVSQSSFIPSPFTDVAATDDSMGLPTGPLPDPRETINPDPMNEDARVSNISTGTGSQLTLGQARNVEPRDMYGRNLVDQTSTAFNLSPSNLASQYASYGLGKSGQTGTSFSIDPYTSPITTPTGTAVLDDELPSAAAVQSVKNIKAKAKQSDAARTSKGTGTRKAAPTGDDRLSQANFLERALGIEPAKVGARRGNDGVLYRTQADKREADNRQDQAKATQRAGDRAKTRKEAVAAGKSGDKAVEDFNKAKAADIGKRYGGDKEDGSDGSKIVCTEMYRQTQLVDWQHTMKIWHVYQEKHLTPYHQVGYHWLFKPYVKGMKNSSILTKLGAALAKHRTEHLRYILTKGKAKDNLIGNVWCKFVHPLVYIAGIVKEKIGK